MPNLVISSDFNLSNPQDFFGNHPIRSDMSSSGFHVYEAATGNNIYISGQNLQYASSGQAISGTVNSIVCITGNGQETLFNLSGANIDIQYDNSQDWASFGQELNYWLGPNPTITTIPGGMGGSQSIAAPAGTNDVYGYTGHNTIVYSAPSSQFTIDVDNLLSPSNGTLTVYQGDPLAPISTNTLHAVQSIQFSDQVIQTGWLTGASMLHTTDASNFSFLSEVYLAYFNRAPDAIGLDFWAAGAYDMHTAQPGRPMSDIIKNIANTFAESPEAISAFGTVNAQSSIPELENFVNKVYTNVLNRTPDKGGLDFWVDALHRGYSSPGEFIYNVVSVVNQQSGTADKLYLSNKMNVGEYFAVTNGLTNLDQASHVMDVYNSTYASSGVGAAVNAARQLTDSYVANLDTQPEMVVHLVGIHG